jgi:putative SOS response-associated peptidase YedK
MPLYLAGLFRTEKDKPLPCFVILTREATGIAAEIHHRMPVIIEKNKIPEWFSGDFDIDSAITDIKCSEADLPLGQISFDL